MTSKPRMGRSQSCRSSRTEETYALAPARLSGKPRQPASRQRKAREKSSELSPQRLEHRQLAGRRGLTSTQASRVRRRPISRDHAGPTRPADDEAKVRRRVGYGWKRGIYNQKFLDNESKVGKLEEPGLRRGYDNVPEVFSKEPDESEAYDTRLNRSDPNRVLTLQSSGADCTCQGGATVGCPRAHAHPT